MKELGFNSKTIKKALQGEMVCSTSSGLKELSPEMQEKLSELQQRFGDDVQFFHVMEYVLPFLGGMYCIDFLMYCPDEWEAFGEDEMMQYIREGEVRVYAWNMDNDRYSEVGPIGVEMQSNGALIRTW